MVFVGTPNKTCNIIPKINENMVVKTSGIFVNKVNIIAKIIVNI